MVTSCVRRTTDSIEKRWCFDVTAQEKGQNPITFQAMGRKDREEWLAALEGKEPDYAALGFIGAGEFGLSFFLSSTELNDSVEDYNSSRVGVVSPTLILVLFPNARGLKFLSTTEFKFRRGL